MFLKLRKFYNKTVLKLLGFVIPGWQLMKCCLQTFPPTEEFANYLEMYLQAKGKDDRYIEVKLNNLSFLLSFDYYKIFYIIVITVIHIININHLSLCVWCV